MGGKGGDGPFILAEAQIRAKELEAILLEIPGVQAIHTCGSIRRKKLMINDCDVVVLTEEANAMSIWDTLRYKLPSIKKLVCGGHEFRMVHNKMQFDLRAFHPKHLAGALLFSTGGARFNIMMRSKAKRMGYKLNRYGLWASDICISTWYTEDDIFRTLNMTPVPPEKRHDDKYEIGMHASIIPIDGSTGNTYDVLLADGIYSCQCEGFKWRRHCRHIDEAKRLML